MISLRLGLRNLARNRWRSALTLAAVGVAVALMVWTLALYEGWIAQMVRGATAVETGQVQIHTAAYVEQPRAYRSFPVDATLLERIRSVPDVRAASPRVELHGLVGNEERSQVGRILGVDPGLEAATTPVAEAVVEGRWLSSEPPDQPAPREAVLGSGLARQLRVHTGDELVVFLEAADGSLGNELLRVVGTVRTGNTQVDRTTVYMHLEDAQVLGALHGEVHEVAIRTDDLTRALETATAVAEALGARRGPAPTDSDASGTARNADSDAPNAPDAAPNAPEADLGAPPDPDALVVRAWQEILPSIQQMLVIFRRSSWVAYLLVYLVAAVGVLNTQRMSAMERRREFGVMMAIGMRPRRMLRTLVAETAVLGLVGAVIGAAAGGLLSWYHATRGFDLTLLADEVSFTYMGVAFSERLYFVLTPEMVAEPVLVMLVVALLSGLWPAFKAARIDPAPTIAGRT